MPTTSLGAAGVPIAYKLPGTYVQVLFGASPTGAGGGPRTVLLLGNMTSTGSATPDTTVYDLFSVDDAKTYFGQGSELHLATQAAFAKAPLARLKAIAVTEAAGAKATATATFVGTAGGDGTLSVFIHGVQIDVAIYNGDLIATMASNLSKAINAKGDLLNVSATSALGVTTITARHNGLRGNIIKIAYVKDASILTTTVTLSGAVLASGTGTDSLTAALATAATQRYHYYAPSSVDLAALQAIQTQLKTMGGPLVGRRQQLICASIDTQGNASTIQAGLNEERASLAWLNKGETLPCQIAAAWAAMRSTAEGTNLSVNLSSMNPDVVDLWPVVKAPRADADWCKDSMASAALDSGITPIQIRPGDKHPYVALSITTHSLDSGGNPDTRTLTTNYVTVPDAFADAFAAWVPSAFVGMKLRDDVQSGDDPLPPAVTTPGVIKSMWKSQARNDFENAGHINNLDGDYAAWAFNLTNGNPNRVSATMPITPAAWFTQTSAQVRQQTP